jgi:hypothetical protein
LGFIRAEKTESILAAGADGQTYAEYRQKSSYPKSYKKDQILDDPILREEKEGEQGQGSEQGLAARVGSRSLCLK